MSSRLDRKLAAAAYNEANRVWEPLLGRPLTQDEAVHIWTRSDKLPEHLKEAAKPRRQLSALEIIMGGAFRPLSVWEPRDQEANHNSEEARTDEKSKGRV